jgi:hypothetical protein
MKDRYSPRLLRPWSWAKFETLWKEAKRSNSGRGKKGKQNLFQTMSTSTLLIIVLILLLVGALPAWPHSRGWGYYPSGGLGLVVLILLILLLLGYL